jgi:N-carbamoylputrescine amidase
MAGVYHNSAYIIDTDGSEAGLYRKMHIRMILIFMKNSILHLAIWVQNHSHERKIGTLIVGINGILKSSIDCLSGSEVLFINSSNRMAPEAIW